MRREQHDVSVCADRWTRRLSSSSVRCVSHCPCLFALSLCSSLCQIPDLEEEARDADLTSAVAEAPNVRSNRVQALQELDQQILFQLPSAMVRARANTQG